MRRALICLIALGLTQAPAQALAPTAQPISPRAASSADRSVSFGSFGQRVTEVQYVLRAHGYSIAVDGVFGPQTQKAVIHWQKANGLLADGIVGPKTWESLQRSLPAAGSSSSGPPAVVGAGLQGKPYAPAGLSGCDEMNWYRTQWGLPDAFSGLGYRESRCGNAAVSRTGCCGGYWQLYVSLFLRDGSMAGRMVACDVNELSDVTGNEPYDKQRSACVARALYDVRGLSPWAL